MAKTMGQALAEQMRRQVRVAETVLRLAGTGTENDRSDTVIGSPENVLSVRGNVSDVAHMNRFFYLNAHASGALSGEVPATLKADLPSSFPEFRAFLAPRENQPAEDALQSLRLVNERLAAEVEGLSDEQLDAPVTMLFPGDHRLRELLFNMIHHGAMHLGQAWGLLKSSGVTDDGFEVLVRG